jgi:hypothetical protein
MLTDCRKHFVAIDYQKSMNYEQCFIGTRVCIESKQMISFINVMGIRSLRFLIYLTRFPSASKFSHVEVALS